MSYSFGTKTRPDSKKNMVASILIFVIIIIVFLFGVSRVSVRTQDQAKETLSLAITRDIVRCYTQEGAYPESLEYLKTHYGLIYDENRFTVDYQPLGQNIMPDVTIIDREGK